MEQHNNMARLHIEIVAQQMTEHRKRPRDPAQLAKMIVDIATGEVEDRLPTPEEQGKDPAASTLGMQRRCVARQKPFGEATLRNR
jgi:hypothetical protein